MRRKKEQRLSARIATVLVASMVSLTIVAQAPSPRPKLVVGIMIDGLRDDYIELLKGYFGEGGFKRLLRDGVVLENVEYGTQVDATTATAMIFSGAPASVNGIPTAMVYDSDTRRQRSIFFDTSTIGNYTDETLSPQALVVSTLSDEIRIDGGGIGSVYAIAPDASQSIVMAGHAGNSAFWINDVTGKWATTTHYKDVPGPITARNFVAPLSTRLDTLTWRPSMTLDNYPDLPAYKKYYPFRHTFPRNDVDRFRNFKTSAPVNTEITALASDYLTGLRLGTREAMDMLNIAYTLKPFSNTKDADTRLETMDSYIKLDQDLSKLFESIDKSIGLSNTFIMVAGTPAKESEKRDDQRWAIHYGEFSPRKAVSLLNVYLMAKYGNGDWVLGHSNNYIHLNANLIKERDHDIKSIRIEAADFLTRMSGVSQVWTIDDIVAGRAGANADAIKRNTRLSLAGDLLIEVNPGWEIVQQDGSKEIRNTVRAGATSSIVFLLSPNLTAEKISTDIDACVIAPTVARILRIRSPNAASMSPLRFNK